MIFIIEDFFAFMYMSGKITHDFGEIMIYILSINPYCLD